MSEDLLKPRNWSWVSVWFLVGNGGMDYGDYYWGLYRDYYRGPFPHSLLSTRQFFVVSSSFYPKPPPKKNPYYC